MQKQVKHINLFKEISLFDKYEPTEKLQTKAAAMFYCAAGLTGANLFGTAFPMIAKLLLILSIAFLLWTNKVNIRPKHSLSLLAALLLIHASSVWCSSIVAGKAEAPAFMKAAFFSLIFFFLVSTISRKQALQIVRTHYIVCVALAVLAIAGNSEYTKHLPTLGLPYVFDGSRYYVCSYFGCTIVGNDAYINFPGIQILRVQSFFDEPGTFAFILLPAIFYALAKKKVICLFLLTIGVVLTWSLGAWLVMIFAGLLAALKFFLQARKTFSRKGLVLGSSLAIIIGTISINSVDLLTSYTNEKLGLLPNQTHSSGGVRVKEISLLGNQLSSSFWGSGFSRQPEYSSDFSVGIFREFVSGGWLSLVFYGSFTIWLIVFFGQASFSSRQLNPSNTWAPYIGLSIVLMGTQRMPVHQTLWGLSMLAAVITLLKKSSPHKVQCQQKTVDTPQVTLQTSYL